MKEHCWATGGVSRIVGELDEVENLMEAGWTLVVYSRHHRIETLKGTEVVRSRRKKRNDGRGSSRGEDASPTVVCVSLEEGEGQESSGLCSWLKTRHKVRTLGRSKALKPGAHAC